MMSGDSETRRIVIMGAAGRDFHNFNVVYRDDPSVQVVAFTATQIPEIAGRRYPAELAGKHYPGGIPILDETELDRFYAELEAGVRERLAELARRFEQAGLPVRKEIVVGRSSQLDMVLVEDMVSRRHAKITVTGDQIFIQDLGSTNGTFVVCDRRRRVPTGWVRS